MFKLPPQSLEVGTTYEFRVDVTDSVGYSSFATQVRERQVALAPSVPLQRPYVFVRQRGF